jgi:alpha-glucoside transport system substrate-binding protein
MWGRPSDRRGFDLPHAPARKENGMAFARSRQALAIAGVLGLALTATACGTGNDKKSDKATSPECAAYEKYQGNDGKKVSIYSSIRDIEADRLEQSWKQFEDCTGIKIDHEAAASSRPSWVSGSTAATPPTWPSSRSRVCSSGSSTRASSSRPATTPRPWRSRTTPPTG